MYIMLSALDKQNAIFTSRKKFRGTAQLPPALVYSASSVWHSRRRWTEIELVRICGNCESRESTQSSASNHDSEMDARERLCRNSDDCHKRLFLIIAER